MAMSSITVAGITPTLAILGAFQEFIFDQPISTFKLTNNFVPTGLIPTQTNSEFRNNTLSGFRWTHTTTDTDVNAFGSLNLQTFINNSPTGTDILNIGNDNIISFYSPVSISSLIIGNDLDMNNNKIIGLAEGTLGTDAVNLNQLNAATDLSVLIAGSTMTGPLVLSGDPVAAMQAATKSYVDDLIIASSDFKTPCHVASTLNLSAIYNNGTSGVGATLTNSGVYEEFDIDGVTVAQGNRVLIKNQSSSAQNGIYVVTNTGSIIMPWILTRAVDYDSSAEITQGNTVPIEYGVVNNRTTWVQSSSVSTIGTDLIVFYQFGYNPSTFLQRANNLSDLINPTTGRLNLGLTDIAIQHVTENSVLIGGESNTIVSLFGTTGQFLVSNGVSNPPTFQTYTGNNLITSVGIVTTGTWQADIIAPAYGGTGVNNVNTITLDGDLVTSGANSLTLTTTGATNVTLPTTGTLVNTAVTTLSSLSSIGTITTGTWNGSVIGVTYGGTGQSTLTNNSLLVGTGTAAVTQLPVGATGTVLAGVTGDNPTFTATPIVSSITINNDPVTSTDGVNKAYVDALTAGLSFQIPCYAATAANLNAIYNNGTLGVGATLTNNGALAAFTTDGQSPPVNARVLVKNQSTTFQNGIYNLTVVGSGAIAWVLTRTTDYDSSNDINPGNLVPVEFGIVNSVSSWIETSTIGEFGVGIDPITFTPFTYNPDSFLESLNNLSDLDNITTARANLGLTNVATQSVTLNNVLIGGSSNAISSLPINNGQLLIGSTGNSPVVAVPTNGTNIDWVTGAGSLTANITGQVALANGGTNASLTASNGGIFYSTASAGAILAGTATANQLLLSGANATPSWSTATYPAVTTINQILYSSATNAVSGIATGNNGTLITSGVGVPSISSTLPTAVQTNITSLGTVTTGVWNGTTVVVANGGTGVATTTAYGVICGGTTTTGALQNAGVGTSGQILTSNGVSELPSWQTQTAISRSYASMYRLTNATSTGNSTYVLIPGGDFTAGLLLNFTFNGSKRLTYTGATTAVFKLLGTSFEDGEVAIIYYTFARNGTVIAGIEMGTDPTSNISFTGLVQLSTNDYIEVYVRTSGSGIVMPVITTVVIEQVS